MMMRVDGLLFSSGLCGKLGLLTRPGFDRGRFSVVDSIAPIGPGRVSNVSVKPGGGTSLDTKQCKRCAETKPVSEFNKKVGHRGDIAARCRECAKAYQAAYRATHKEQLRAYNLAYMAAHPKPKNPHSERKPRSPQQPPLTAEEKNARARARRATNIEARREYEREYRRRRKEQAAEMLLELAEKRNRHRRRAARVEHVDIRVLIERDQGICGICKKGVMPGEQSIDHILPITQGGEDSYANTQLAHRDCNRKKGNRGASQLRMIGGPE